MVCEGCAWGWWGVEWLRTSALTLRVVVFRLETVRWSPREADVTNNLKPVSIEEVERKALTILVAGFERRGQRRSAAERAKRAPEKLARDELGSQRPRVCAL